MSDRNNNIFRLLFVLVCVILFVVAALRCWLVPFAHDEVATFYFYVQKGDFLPFLSHPDANGHFLMSLTSWLSFELFGSSPFALRLPSLLALPVFFYGAYRLSSLFSGLVPRIFFSAMLLCSFNFLCFYSLCRGYGISMSFLALSLFYFFNFLRAAHPRDAFRFMLHGQLALAANLTLVVVLLLLTFFLALRQFKDRKLLNGFSIVAHLVNLSLIGFWARYGFYLKEQGALYYGEGNNYWDTTFSTLIETVYLKNQGLEMFLFACFVLVLIVAGRAIYKDGKIRLENTLVTGSLVFSLLVAAFYLLKKIFGVNYPEDRTGLFFYLVFILVFGLFLQEIPKAGQALSLTLPLALTAHFLANVNFRTHPWRIYETMPRSFFDRLVEEQKGIDRPITIGGHRVREFIYGFHNYNSQYKLSHMTAPEALQMNCDFALAYRQDQPYYSPYYDELAREDDWGFRLLKRKEFAGRKLLVGKREMPALIGPQEYYNLYETHDTLFSGNLPLLAEISLEVKSARAPLNAWLVLQVDAENSSDNIFVRTPLDLVAYDWEEMGLYTTTLVSGAIPLNAKRVVVYLWNIDKKDISISFKSFKLYQLSGEGVNVVSPAKI